VAWGCLTSSLVTDSTSLNERPPTRCQGPLQEGNEFLRWRAIVVDAGMAPASGSETRLPLNGQSDSPKTHASRPPRCTPGRAAPCAFDTTALVAWPSPLARGRHSRDTPAVDSGDVRARPTALACHNWHRGSSRDAISHLPPFNEANVGLLFLAPVDPVDRHLKRRASRFRLPG
jgi:hypothetical protein